MDFDKATQDPANPKQIRPSYNIMDHLHPNDAGYKAMADSMNLSIFTGQTVSTERSGEPPGSGSHTNRSRTYSRARSEKSKAYELLLALDGNPRANDACFRSLARVVDRMVFNEISLDGGALGDLRGL